jgi:hypothetical protein
MSNNGTVRKVYLDLPNNDKTLGAHDLRSNYDPFNGLYAVRISKATPFFSHQVLIPTAADTYQWGHSSLSIDNRINYVDDGGGQGHWVARVQTTVLTIWTGSQVEAGTPPYETATWTPNVATGSILQVTQEVLSAGQNLVVQSPSGYLNGTWSLFNSAVMQWLPPGAVWNNDAGSFQVPTPTGVFPDQSLVYTNYP